MATPYEIDGPVDLGTSGVTTTIKGSSVTFEDNSETIDFGSSNTPQNFVLQSTGDMLFLNGSSALAALAAGTSRFTLRTSTGGLPEWTNSTETDAIVDPTVGNGDYTTVGAAFTGGATSVFVRAGTYSETVDITIPDGGSLVGERAGGVVLSLGTGVSIIAGSTPANRTTAGTISIPSGSTTVTGVGTDFDGTISGNTLNPGDYILLHHQFYEIASITSKTTSLRCKNLRVVSS